MDRTKSKQTREREGEWKEGKKAGREGRRKAGRKETQEKLGTFYNACLSPFK